MDRLTRFFGQRSRQVVIAAVSAGVVSWAAAAAAQTRPAQQGPLVLQPSSDGPVFAPEVKYSGFEDGGSNGTFVGGYGGWLFDSKLLLGGGASFLVDHGHHDKVSGMGYGGFVAGWTVPVGQALHVGVRGLVGFGQAELTDTFTYTMYDRGHGVYPDPRHGMVNSPPAGTGTAYTGQYRWWDDFFIFEPQGTAVVRLARGVALDVSGGYRVIAGMDRYNSWLRGFSGGVAVRIGPKL
jgi:hypothetical protein